MIPKAIFNWSTGKDSALALHKVLQSGEYDVAWLLTTVNARYDRVSMHGVRTELLEAQSASLGIPLVQVRLPDTPTMDAYECAMRDTLGRLRDEGATVSIFGDIFLEDLRVYRERQLKESGLQAVFPLWQTPTDVLAREVLDLGFTAMTTCVNAQYLDRSFAGREFNDAFLRELPAEVDPCGENGEFHTFVCDGPVFEHPVRVAVGEIVHRQYEQLPVRGEDEAADDAAAESLDSTGRESYECGSRSEAKAGDETTPGAAGFWYCDLLRT